MLVVLLFQYQLDISFGNQLEASIKKAQRNYKLKY